MIVFDCQASLSYVSFHVSLVAIRVGVEHLAGWTPYCIFICPNGVYFFKTI